MWSKLVKRWSGVPFGYNVVSGEEEEAEGLVTQEHTINNLTAMAVCSTNSMSSLNGNDFAREPVVSEGMKKVGSGVDETDSCSRDHGMKMSQAEGRRTTMKQNGMSTLGVPAQQFAAAQRRSGLALQRKGSAEGIVRNGSMDVPGLTESEHGGIARRAQSFSVKRAPAANNGSRLMQPGFKSGKQYSAALGFKSAGASPALSGSGGAPHKPLNIVEGHFSAEPSPTAARKTGLRVPSFRSKSVGRGAVKTADKGSSLKPAGDNGRKLQQPQRQVQGNPGDGVGKAPPGRDRSSRATSTEVPSGNKPVKSGPAPITVRRGPSRAESSCNSPSNSRPSSLYAAPPPTAGVSGIPRPKPPQQSHLARIASRLASLVSYHVGGGGGGGKGARSGPVAATEKQALISSKSSTPTRPISPSSPVSTTSGTEKGMSPVFLRRTLTSPPGSKIPRPTSSLSSSRRSSAASSPEPEICSSPASGFERAEQHARRVASPDMTRRRSSTPSVPALAEKSFKALSPQRQSTPAKERTATDSTPLAVKSRARFDSTISETGQSDDSVLLDDSLEGQVTIDPDEYRRLQQEVKMMKTVLLKLRRELQGDQSPSSPQGIRQFSVDESPPTQLDAVCKERDKALAALECVRADLRRREDTITQLSSELEAARSQSTSLRGQVEELGRSRDELIDRVERLYAEKHKLEGKVAQSEQHAQSMLVGDFDDLLSESLDGSSMKEERGQAGTVDSMVLSDGGKGENSDPESEAVVTSTDVIN